MTHDYAPLNAEQVATLQRFAAWSDARNTPKGRKRPARTWKDELSMVYWYNARPWKGEDGRDDRAGACLHKLRNTHGPCWLEAYTLPQAGA